MTTATITFTNLNHTKNSFIIMNHSDCDDDTQPHPQQGQQRTQTSPSSSAQTTPLDSKSDNIWKVWSPTKQEAAEENVQWAQEREEV